MALVYTGTDGLFTHLGKLVKFYNQFKSDAVALASDRDEILDAFQASDMDVSIDGLVSAFERWKAEYTSRRGELAAFALQRLRDKDSILDEIGAASIEQEEIMRKLLEAMDDDSATVKSSSVTIGSVSIDSDNAGGGKILTTNVLDGATPPGAINGVFFPSQFKYNGVTTELCAPSQKFTFRVVADSFQDQVPEGSEEIAWDGTLADEPQGVGEDGSGAIATIQPVHATTAERLDNADFESFTSNVPDDWTLVAGSRRHQRPRRGKQSRRPRRGCPALQGRRVGIKHRTQAVDGGHVARWTQAILPDGEIKTRQRDHGNIHDSVRGNRVYRRFHGEGLGRGIQPWHKLPTAPFLRDDAGLDSRRLPSCYSLDRRNAR